jgi:hypothetical protein
MPSATLETKLSEFKSHTGYTYKTFVKDIVYIIKVSPNYLGPSRVNCRFAVKVDPEDIDKWLDIYSRTYDLSVDYKKDIYRLHIPWKYESYPEYYNDRSGGYAVVYRKEGVIIFHTYM